MGVGAAIEVGPSLWGRPIKAARRPVGSSWQRPEKLPCLPPRGQVDQELESTSHSW